MTRQSKMWTKEEIKQVTTLWETSTMKQMLETLNVTYTQLAYIVKEIRKAGYNLPRKRANGNIQTLIKDALNLN